MWSKALHAGRKDNCYGTSENKLPPGGDAAGTTRTGIKLNMADSKNLLENYAKRLGSTGRNRNLYLRYAEEFLNFAGGNFERESIQGYIAKLKRKGYSEGTINLKFRIIRTLFGRNKMEWPFAQGEAPQIRESLIVAPALHPHTIARMIEAVKDGEPDERAFLALSTTYGLRRVEMVGLLKADIRLKDKTIHIATAKHGRERTHIIPDELIPHLVGYDFDTPRCEFNLFTLWYRLENKIGLEHIPQVGFHSIRRTLNTLLLKELPDATVMSFLRWKQRTSSHMPFRYSAVTFVGEEENLTEVVGEALDVDSEVFRKHPFVKCWR